MRALLWGSADARTGNNLKMGIVGLPNVGKSTFFNMLSKLNVAAENFPFCTIDPNVSRVPIPVRALPRPRAFSAAADRARAVRRCRTASSTAW